MNRAMEKAGSVKPPLLTEAEKVEQWRIHEALEITGCTLNEAIQFASSDGDLHKLASLVSNGCSGELALRIA